MLSLFFFLSKWIGWDSYTFVLNLCSVLIALVWTLDTQNKISVCSVVGVSFSQVSFLIQSAVDMSSCLTRFLQHMSWRRQVNHSNIDLFIFSFGSACLSPFVILLKVYWRVLSHFFAIIFLNVHLSLRCGTAVTVRMIELLHLIGFKNDVHFKK